MNGQLSEQPLAELIREISLKSLGGRLHLQHDKINVVAYFTGGAFVYAAANIRTLRLREYLLKAGAVSEDDLARLSDKQSDTKLADALCTQNVLAPDVLEQVQTKLVIDVLRMALLWTTGTWEFDSRSHLNENVSVQVDAGSLLLEAGRRIPLEFTQSRFADPHELISPATTTPAYENLLPTEVFLLSRVDRPLALSELLAISGLAEPETLRLIYALVLGAFLQREHRTGAFDGQQPQPEKKKDVVVTRPAPSELHEITVGEDDDIHSFLDRLINAQSHYEALGVSKTTSSEDLKSTYYHLARRYHPDRFRRADSALLARIESGFARITQAYDTLRDEVLRARYDSKLNARARANTVAESAPKATTRATPSSQKTDDAQATVMSVGERAELKFKEGFAALELGQRNTAIGLLAAAAGAVPNEPRYRAYYGRALAIHESTRRAAEAELQAAVKLEPNNAEYRVMLAELYRDLGLTLRAKGEAERAVASDPNNRKARDLFQTLK